MADLIPCPSCKKKISVEAQACPKCGQPITDEARAAGRKKMKEEKRAGRVGCVFFIVAAIALAAWLGKTDKADKGTPTPAAVSQAAPTPQQNPPADAPKEQAETPKPVFNLTPEQFVKNFNAAAKGIDTKLRAKITKTSSGSVQLAMSKQCGAVLTMRDGKIADVVYIGVPDGTMDSGSEIVLGIAFTIAGVRPDWNPEKRGIVLKRLMGDTRKMPEDAKTDLDGIHFELSFAKGTGLFFSVSPQ